MNRKAHFSGSFYPSDPQEINRYINHFETVASQHATSILKSEKKLSALVVPHAGYVYSGFTAHLAFKVLEKENPKTVFVIGPSHHHYFLGLSIAALDTYETPLGMLTIDTKLVNVLQEIFTIPYVPDAHDEHSTEVQMPFIKHYCPDAKVVEIVYGDTKPKEIEPILEYLLNLDDVIIVISTDLSHFYTLDEAKAKDTKCIDAFKKLNVKQLHTGCEACGILGLEAMMGVAASKGLQSQLLDYRTSADASDDRQSVVGYMSGIFTKEGS
ncbi:MAG: AmmeMemoRadiSam system protein B [Thiovulaceae bacterium]|nr:AmmeMemoRadiSam system protein B [Sulfurimonadaceae bacterium]